MFTPTQPLLRALRRLALTTKQVNGGYYKGNRTGSMGRHTTRGGYIIEWRKVRTYVVPPNLADCKVSSPPMRASRLYLMTFVAHTLRFKSQKAAKISEFWRPKRTAQWRIVPEPMEGGEWDGLSPCWFWFTRRGRGGMGRTEYAQSHHGLVLLCINWRPASRTRKGAKTLKSLARHYSLVILTCAVVGQSQCEKPVFRHIPVTLSQLGEEQFSASKQRVQYTKEGPCGDNCCIPCPGKPGVNSLPSLSHRMARVNPSNNYLPGFTFINIRFLMSKDEFQTDSVAIE